MVRRLAFAGAVALFACGPAFAISQQFKLAKGWNVPFLPSGNDTGRLAPMKANRAVLSQMGIGVYFAQEARAAALQNARLEPVVE